MSTVSKVIITTIIVVVVVLGGWWIIASMSGNDGANNGGGSSNGTTGQNGSSEPTGEVAATITYDGSDFTPVTVTVQVGDTIEVMNDSTNVMFFASDEHPTHLNNSELNVGDIQPGESATFTVSSAGTWGYHDHYNASMGGEIIVEE